MKKILTVFFSCLLIVAATGCSCSKYPVDEQPEDNVLPAIPEGVVLNDVAAGEMVATIEDFSVKYQNSKNVYLNFYKTYTAESGGSKSTGTVRYEGKTFGDNADCENYKDALGDLTVKNCLSYINSDGILEEQEDVSVFKLRGESCAVVSDGFSKKRGGSVFERGSGLTGMYIDGYHGNEAPMDYMIGLYNYTFRLTAELNYIADMLADAQSYIINVKADATKLYAYICRNAENAAPLYCFYLDTAAANSAAEFDGGEPTFVQTADILYYSLDREEFLRDFMDNKAITLKPYGNGEIENLTLLGGYFDVQFIYDGNVGNTNLNVGFSGGEIYFPEDAFKVFCGKVNAENFDIDKLTLFYFTVKVTYDGTRTVSGVTERKECVTEIFIDY